MADVKISELPALTTSDGAEELVVNDGGTTKKITGTNLLAGYVSKNSTTGAASMPSGTTAQRPTGALGMFRHNSTLDQFEGYNDGEWGALAGGGELSKITYEFIATAGQTSFTGSDLNSNTLSYTVGSIIVSYGGLDLAFSDYTATNGSSITLADGAVVGKIVRIVAFTTFAVADTYTQSQANTLLAAKSPLASPVFTGNVGVGVTPANNATPASGLQVGATASIGAWESGSNIITTIGSNSYFNSTYKYITTNTAALIRLINGAINFNVAPSGSADAAISWITAMNINAAGIVTKPYQPAFSAYRNAGDVTSGVIVCNGEHFDTGGDHNTSTGRFTAPVAGKYMISSFHMSQNSTTYNNKYYTVNVNGSIYKEVYNSSGSAVHHQFNWSGIIQLAANDYVTLNYGDFIIYGGHANYSTFSGHLIG